MSSLIKENTILQKQLQGANKQYYEDLLVYVRLNSMGKNERQTEEMLLGILQDILEAQQNGVSAEDYFGKDPQPIADELLEQLPNDSKQMVKLSLLAVLIYFAVVFIGSYFVSLFQPGTPQLIDVGEYVICSICAGVSTFVILWLMGKNYGQKNSWKMLFTIGGIFVINCLLFVFIRTPWVIPLSRWMATVLAIILAVSVYLLNRDKNFGDDHGKKET